jgi:carboxypeptidase Q
MIGRIPHLMNTMKKATTMVAFFFMWAVPTQAQEPVDLEMTSRIMAEGLERSQVLAMYTHLTDAIGPRLAGSPAYDRAVEWSMDRLHAFGVDQVYTEPFEFGRSWTLEGLTLEMISPRYFPLFGYPEAWTPSTDGTVVGKPVYVGDRTAEEIGAMGSALKGAIVLSTPPHTQFITVDRLQPGDSEERVPIGAPRSIRPRGEVSSREMAPLLAEVGAGVVMRPNQGQHGTIFVLGNRNTPDDAVPSVVMASEHYNMIARMVEAGLDVQVRVGIESRYHEDDLNTYNVLAEIPGTDPEVAHEVVLIGGHMDSWHSSPGGSDNADGVASTLEAIRILKTLGVQPRRTIRIALWGGEEEGLLGSRAWVEEHLAGDHNAGAREDFYVYFNNDPGYGKIFGWYLEENAAVKPIFDAWLEPLKEVGATRNVLDAIGSTDHVPFVRVGVPGFNAIQDYRDYDVRTHHTNQDFHERVVEEDLKQAAIVLATFAYHAAMRVGPLPGFDGEDDSLAPAPF